MVNCIKPQPGEIIQDPAAGTGGFLTHADRYIKKQTDQLFTLKAKDQNFQRKRAFVGCEWVPDTPAPHFKINSNCAAASA